ncbi:hypothetical protein SETIT_8G059300v2 [Setaria italica]|uniref:DUF1618 domain-containing protein n=1 Tax=Setaria italica TaxID=4555 RepID=A0A368S4L5_SETIT|nr:hypothetical protein SETIT_8G059300v2 [Setaria italica]
MANQPDGAAAAAAYPPWVLLERFCTPVVRGSSIVDTKTLAAGYTTTNHPIAVALCVAPPPEVSRVSQLPDGVQQSASAVLAAHGDSVLIKVPWLQGRGTDHFIYNAGDTAAATPRPPSLLLLFPIPPGCYQLDPDRTGLLRRGEDEFVVAELRMPFEMGTMWKEAELHLFRSGEWCVKRPLIHRYDDGSEDRELASSWWNDIVVPVGDEMLCWVDLSRGLIFSKVFEESLRLRTGNVCVTASGVAVKFVNIFPRCCCGDAAHSFCRRSCHAYTVQTWTLTMDDMTWVMDGLLDATQLWTLNGYKGLPRVELDYPVENHENDYDKTMRVIMVDMKSKTLRSVFRYPEVRARGGSSSQYLRPSRVSSYFNCKASSSKPDSAQAQTVPSLASKTHVETELQYASKAASPEATILAVLEEIPGLDSWIIPYGTPMNLRKDCVLLDIKASEACLICSACSADLQL